jgi:hypothetical protein
MEACLEKMEATNLEANPEEIEFESGHQEAPKEEVAVETIRALEDQHGHWHLAIGCHRQPKKQIQGTGGSQKKLVPTQRWMTRHAILHCTRTTVIKD